MERLSRRRGEALSTQARRYHWEMVDTVKRVEGYQVVVTTAPGHVLFGATSRYESAIFDTEEEAKWFLDDVLQQNERAGRKVAESKIVKGTWDIKPFLK